ncbi:MAG: pyruvate kinase [Phycisphaerae bacterium]
MKPGNRIYADDGRIVFEVKSVERKRLKTKILTDGQLEEHKGINIPDSRLEFESFTEKDRNDIEVGIENKFEYISQSFVRNADDIRKVKEIVGPRWKSCRIIAKIESRDALANIDDIIDQADGIMVARGDLGICVPIYEIPFIQKLIIKKCRQKNKPVIVATQMLESMTTEVLPTRAEVTDVANAILDGATHLMLSGETAVGKYPAETVEMMNEITKATENYQKKPVRR